ncbi:hypothetical protein MKX01_012169 [Papaver californicum]|nr:hypothetical protein MKX01_012169 [Papaver californicum]
MHEEREARLRVEAELRSTKERLAGRTAATFNSANTKSSSETEASINTQHNHSAGSKPSSPAGSSPKIVKDGEEKGIDDEIIQSNRNIDIGKSPLVSRFVMDSATLLGLFRFNFILHNLEIVKIEPKCDKLELYM